MTVTPSDIAVRLGRPSPAEGTPEFDQWSLWITDALMLISARFTLADLDPARLDYVVREAVAAQVLRPDDATDVTVSVDDASVSKRYSSATGRVRILDEWWALLDPSAGASTREAFAIDTTSTGGPLADHADVCSLRFGGVYCSCGANLTAGRGPLWETLDPADWDAL